MITKAMLQKENDTLRERVTELENQLVRQTQTISTLQEKGGGRDTTEHKRAEGTLWQSEQKYRQLFSEMSSGCALHEIIFGDDSRPVDYITVEVNHAFETYLNIKGEDVIGQKASEILPPTELEKWLEIFGPVALTGKSTHYEMFSPLNQKYFEGSAYCPEKGKFAITFADVTKRKQMEAALNESEAKYRLLVEAANEGIWAMDQDHRTTYVNQAMAGMLGYAPTEILGKKVEDFFFAEDMAFHNERMRQRHAGQDEVYERRFKRRDGSALWTLVSARVIKDSQGEFSGSFAMFTDITERKRVEEALRQSEALLTEAQRIGHIGHWEWTAPGREIVCSDELLHVLGLPEDSGPIFLENIKDRVSSAEQDRLFQLDQKIFAGQGHLDYEFCINRPDGRLGWLHQQAYVTYAEHGQPVRMIGVIQDITERKQMEAERQVHLHFFTSMDRVNRAIQEAHDLEQMMSDVLDVVLSIFDCDRAFLVHPCDPAAATWRAPMERTNPEYPGVLAVGLEMPLTPYVAETFRILLIADGPVKFGPEAPYPLPVDMSERFGFKSLLAMALYPKGDQPWQFGLHQCAYARSWTADEARLFQEIGRRLADALTNLLQYRDLSDSERRLTEAQRIAHVGYWERDLEAGRIILSDEACRIFGLAPQDFPPNLEQWHPRWLALIHPDDRDRIAQAIAGALQDDLPYNIEYRVIRPNGEVRFVHSEAVVSRDESGCPRSMLGMMQDITERKRAERELYIALEKYRVLFETFPLGISITDEKGNLIEVNRESERLLGLGRENHTRRTYDGPEWRIIRPDGTLMPPDEYASVRALKEKRRVENVEMGIVKDGGEITWLTVTAAPIPLEGYGVAVTYGDITARKQAEAALHESEERFRLFMDNSPTIAWIQNDQSRYVYFNQTYEKRFGVQLEAWRGKTIFEVWPTEEAQRLWQNDQKVLAADHLLEFTEEIPNPDGSLSTWWSFKFPFQDASGQRYVAGIALDITQQQQVEAERAKLKEQLHQAQKMESIGRLAGGVAHDFNNLLTVILGYSELMQTRLPLSGLALERLEQIRQAAKRAEGLTRQLLAFSRKQVLVPEVFDLNGLVTNLKKMLERLVPEDITLITTLQPDLWWIKADPGQLEQVIMNLAVNARDAMPNGGRLTIETANVSLDDPFIQTQLETLPGPGVKLTVTDTGCGMDEATLTHIFEPFFTTKEKGKGTGLGLSTVYGIVKQSGGEITVDSQLGKGAVFTIYLPAHTTDLTDSATPQPKAVAQPGRETILLVEDEAMVRDFVQVALRDYGYTLLEVDHGYQALALAQQEKSIDLLLTDVVMPDINGRELAERIRALHPHLKVLFMSGYTDDEVLRHGVQMAEVEFIAKPFSPVVLAAKVRTILDK